MKIGVCVKQVPAKDAPLAIARSGMWIRESDIGFELNEPDSYALEEGTAAEGKTRRRSGGDFDGARAREADHQGSAGQGRGSRHSCCWTINFSSWIRWASPARWPRPFEKENFDLILTGLQSEDQGFGQTGVLLAELLGLPHATIIMQIDMADGAHEIEARTGGGMVPVGGIAAAGGAFDSVGN